MNLMPGSRSIGGGGEVVVFVEHSLLRHYRTSGSMANLHANRGH
jgi:hypothetical protein